MCALLCASIPPEAEWSEWGFAEGEPLRLAENRVASGMRSNGKPGFSARFR